MVAYTFGLKYYIDNLFKIENLVLWARSETIGSAVYQTCSGRQVSGVSKCRNLSAERVATENQHRWKQVHFMGDFDTVGRIRLLTPETW